MPISTLRWPLSRRPGTPSAEPVETQHPRAAAGTQLGFLREFFAHHGVWAPGVKLLRLLNIRDKMALIAALVLVPALLLVWQVARQQVAQAHSATQRLAGLRLASAASAMGVEVGAAARLRASGQAPAADHRKEVHLQLQQAYAEALATGLPLQAVWERSRVALERALASSSEPPIGQGVPTAVGPEGYQTLNQSDAQALHALVTLREEVVRQSSVTALADPELHAHARLVVDSLPALQVALGQLQMAVGQLDDGPAETPVAVSTAPATSATHPGSAAWVQAVAALAVAAERADAFEPAWRQVLVQRQQGAAEATLPAVQRYLRLVRRQVIVAAVGGADAGAAGGTDVSTVLQAGAAVSDAPTLRSAYAAARDEVHSLRLAETQHFDTRLMHSLDAALWARNALILSLLLGFTLTAYLVYTFFLVMRGGLDQLNLQIRRMADGDLSSRAMPHGVDEVAKALHGMTQSLERLSDLMATVNQGVGGVKNAAQMVASGNAELTQRNQQTSESMGVMVDSVARSAAQLQSCGRQVEGVVDRVQALRLESARNRKQMQRLRERMTALRSQSREIGEMVTLIDNVAFRTNLLALNASVQASKAGESGRGFAVVAQEVRALAARGAESARRIGEIARRSTEDIELSHALVENTGQALADADLHVDQIHVAMDSVAGLTRAGEQESGALLDQLTRIKKASAETLGLMEQVAQASDGMRSLGDRLAYLVGRFRLS